MFLNGILIDGKENVIFRLLEVYQPDPLAAFLAVFLYGDRYAFGKYFMKGFVGVDTGVNRRTVSF